MIKILVNCQIQFKSFENLSICAFFFHLPDGLDGEPPLGRDDDALGREVVRQELALEQLQGMVLERLQVLTALNLEI